MSSKFLDDNFGDTRLFITNHNLLSFVQLKIDRLQEELICFDFCLGSYLSYN